MKKTIAILTTALLLVGCTQEESTEVPVVNGADLTDVQVKVAEEVDKIPVAPKEVNKEAIKERFKEIVNNTDGMLLEIRPNQSTKNYNQMELVVNSTVWNSSSYNEQLEFSETMWKVIADVIYEHGAVERGGTIKLTIYDQNGNTLADQSIWNGEFSIKSQE